MSKGTVVALMAIVGCFSWLTEEIVSKFVVKKGGWICRI
jgi:hypothetical protein